MIVVSIGLPSNPLYAHAQPPHTHIQASTYNKSGDYYSAKKYGRASLFCNIGVYIFIILANIAWIVYIIVVTVQRNTPNIICAPGSRAPPCIGRG